MLSPWIVVLSLVLFWVLTVVLNGVFQGKVAPYLKDQFTKTMVAQANLLLYLLLGFGAALLTKNLYIFNFSLSWVAWVIRILVVILFLYQLIPVVGLLKGTIANRHRSDEILFHAPLILAAVLTEIASTLIFFCL